MGMSIREWIIAISTLLMAIVMVIAFWLNNIKSKTRAPSQTKEPSKHIDFKRLLVSLKGMWTQEGLFNLAKIVLVAVLCLFVVVVTTGFSQSQIYIYRTIKEIQINEQKSEESLNRCIHENEERLKRCIHENAEAIINRLEFYLFIGEPNNVK